MRTALASFALVLALLLAPNTALAAPRFFVSGGVGFPELVHVEGGLWLSHRLDLGLRVSDTLFNPMVGLQVDGVLLGDASAGPPRHGLLLSGRAQVNPTPPFGLVSGGEHLASSLTLEGGYAFRGTRGLLLRASAGAILSLEDGIGGGPNASLSVGWSP